MYIRNNSLKIKKNNNKMEKNVTTLAFNSREWFPLVKINI